MSRGCRWTGRRIRIGCYLVATLAFVLVFHRFLFLNNFDVVEPGRVYRSAQPKLELAETIRAHGIASVLNLRGGSPADWWYQNERATTARLGVVYHELPMRHNQRPRRAELLHLLDILERGPFPLLIHCKSGSDRTGLAASLYRLCVLGESPNMAIQGFSLLRGHIPLFGTERLHDPIDAYREWLAASGATHSPARFRDWIATHYHDGSAPASTVESGRLARRVTAPAGG